MLQRTLFRQLADTALLGTVRTILKHTSEVSKKTLIYAFLPIAVGNPFFQIPKVTKSFTQPQKAPAAAILPITGSPLEAKIQVAIVTGKATDEEIAKENEPAIEPVPYTPVVRAVEETPRPTPNAEIVAKIVKEDSQKEATDSTAAKTEAAITDQQQIDANTVGLTAAKKAGQAEADTSDAAVDEPPTFIWPATGSISQGFSAYHTGIDIPGPLGTAVNAAAPGVVSAVVKDAYGYGWYVIVDHKDNHQTLYAHLSQISVTIGQKLKQGQLLGLRGSTGRSTGSHLHFEVIRNSVKVNPLSVLK